jgi:hypothetical protein
MLGDGEERNAINASVGDEIVVDPVQSGEVRREGEVLEVHERGDVVSYLVRWDDGHETLFLPGSTTHVVRLSNRPRRGAERASDRRLSWT